MHGTRHVHGGNTGGDFDEEAREGTMVALLLSYLKYKILKPATAKTLELMKKEFLANNNNIIVDEVLRIIEEYNPPDIPPVPQLHGIVGRCSKPFEKQLTSSDLSDDQSRLSMNKVDVEECLLPLLNGENLERGIPVRLYDRDGFAYSATFKRWVGKINVLTGAGWKQLYKKYVLKRYQHFVTVWMFYHAFTGELCFAITWRELPVHQPYNKKRTNQAIVIAGGD